MRYKRVLLVNPSYANTFFKTPMWHPPAGLGYIAQSLQDNGIEYEVIDMSLGADPKALIKKILSFKPDLVGISMMTFSYENTYEMISGIKKTYNNAVVIAGGPHVSTLRDVVLKQCPDIDYGCVLEGEQTIIDLCAEKELSDIPGLIYRQNADIIMNQERPFACELDNINYPRYKGFELDKYLHKIIGIVSSRGCPFECIYCPVHSAIGRKFRMRSAKNIMQEITYWYDKGYRMFDFVDDNFTLDKGRVLEICELIQKSDFKGIQFRCPNGIRADKTDPLMLQRMRESGFTMIAFGIESGSDKILKIMKKNEDAAKMDKAVASALEAGFEVVLYFIIGLPGETREDIEKSVNFALKYPVSDARFYNVIPFPKTELYEWVKKNNRFLKTPEYYLNHITPTTHEPVFDTEELSREDKIKALKYCAGITKRIYRNKLKRKLPFARPVNNVLSWIISTDVVQNIYAGNACASRIINTIKKAINRG